MKANTWKTILQIAISILTAIATTLGVTSCMDKTKSTAHLYMRRAVVFGHGHFQSLRISDYQNTPLSYKIRLNQVRSANKIHPYNQLSEYFLYFCRYIA